MVRFRLRADAVMDWDSLGPCEEMKFWEGCESWGVGGRGADRMLKSPPRSTFQGNPPSNPQPLSFCGLCDYEGISLPSSGYWSVDFDLKGWRFLHGLPFSLSLTGCTRPSPKWDSKPEMPFHPLGSSELPVREGAAGSRSHSPGVRGQWHSDDMRAGPVPQLHPRGMLTEVPASWPLEAVWLWLHSL